MDTNQPDSAPQPDANRAGNLETTENNGGEQDTFDRAYVEKLRAENAKYRNKAKELEPMAQKMRELEEVNKTDLEKAQERIAELEALQKASELEVLRSKVAVAHGVPAALLPAEGDEESLSQAAKALVEWANKHEPDVKSLPGSRAAGADVSVSDRDAQFGLPI
ncbi:Uncharacterised protein [Corynebacterium renale]|uniref:Scaffolding protein n=2 Tax=Corynebacterium renale TaxID=1724 RepID=A0A2A9DQR6_9CORY|nr:hypothetical protein ATK06_1429 [Corynebacterium renale]SQI19008.1 Uncharacterised protein [Corynebacterium renale]